MAVFIYRNVGTNQTVYVPWRQFDGNPLWELVDGAGAGGGVTEGELTAHEDDSTGVHGIPNTALLATLADAQAKADAAAAASIPLTQKGAANGVATLDSGSKLPHAQVPPLAGTDLTSGTVAYARLPIGTASSTVAAGDDSRITGAVPKGALAINVRDYGAVGNGSDETAALNAALAAAAPGATVVFPKPTTYYSINAALTVPTGVTVVGGGKACEIRQATTLKPVFDLFNTNDVTIRGFKLTLGPGSPATTGSSFRGDSEYAYCVGVWTNGSRNHFSDLRIVNFAMGIYLAATNSAGTVNNDGAQRYGNVVHDIEVSGHNHGVLFLCQTGLRISGVYSHDHVDSSSGTNPNHAVYGTGTTTLTSNDVAISDCVTANLTFGVAYQVKYINGLAMSNLVADTCNGLFNGIDLADAVLTGLTSRGDTTTGSSNWSFALQRVTNRPIRLAISNVQIQMAAGDGQPMIIIADDARLSNITLYSNRSGVATSQYDLHLRGLRITADGIRIFNSGSSQYRGVLVGATAYTCGDVTVANLESTGLRTLVDFDTSITGVNVVDYNPGLQRSMLLGATNYIDQVGGTAAFSISRRDWTTITAITGGATATPRPPLETVSRFEVGDATAFTVAAPACRPKTGMIQHVDIVNTTGAALGTITWNAIYALTTTYQSPPAGGAYRITFVYDGTNWREISRSSGADPTAWLGTYLTSDTVTVGEVVPTRDRITSNSIACASGSLILSYFTALRTESITTVAAYSGATAAAATPTLVRYGIYSVAGNGDLTLIASTVSDTAIFATINTAYPKSLSAPFAKVAGVRYAVGVLVVTGATAPSLHGLQMSPTGVVNALVRQTPYIVGRFVGQTDLPSTVAVGSLAGYQGMPAFDLY